jgi:glycosyltransferase involved in cell wall biosynthesis
MMDLDILTFNSHQTFVYNFAKIGARIYVIHKIPGKAIQRWDEAVRPQPPNVTLISLAKARELCRRGRLDLAVCHNISDLMAIRDIEIKKILCLHGTVKGRIVTEGAKISEKDWNDMVKSYIKAVKNLHIVFVSKKKSKGRDLDGTIIELGVDPEEYHGYTGNLSKVLTVVNQFIMRRKILGYHLHRAVTRSVGCDIVGNNPGLPGSEPAKNWEHLKEIYRRHRLYLFTALGIYEDGYNTAMLEAMATGMPVVSYTNDSSPIIDGVNGFISDNISCLRERVRFLLDDRDLAAQMGKAARRTVVEQFGIQRFVDKWKRLIIGFI